MAALPHLAEPPFVPTKHCAGCKRDLDITPEHWYFRSDSAPYSAGKPYGPCRECRARVKTKSPSRPHGLVPVEKVYVLMRELRDRCGSAEKASEYSGINTESIRQICDRKTQQVRKQTVRLMVLALYERRKLDRLNGVNERFLAARRYQANLEERMARLTGY